MCWAYQLREPRTYSSIEWGMLYFPTCHLSHRNDMSILLAYFLALGLILQPFRYGWTQLTVSHFGHRPCEPTWYLWLHLCQLVGRSIWWSLFLCFPHELREKQHDRVHCWSSKTIQWNFTQAEAESSLLWATTSCMFRLNCCPFTVPEHLYRPSSSNHTSFRVADLSEVGPKIDEDGEKENRVGSGLKKDPGFLFSQTTLVGIKSGEKTQGSVAADPKTAYTLVLSLGGRKIPVREHKRKILGTVAKEEEECWTFNTLI